MKCYYHNDRDAVIQCNKCGKALCNECDQFKDNLCLDCSIKQNNQIIKDKKEFRKKMVKKKYYIIVSIFLSFVLCMYIYYSSFSNISSIAEFNEIIFCIILYTIMFGSIPSGFRAIVNTSNNNSNNRGNNFFLFGKNPLFSILFLIFGGIAILIVGCSLIGPFALIYELYKIRKSNKDLELIQQNEGNPIYLKN